MAGPFTGALAFLAAHALVRARHHGLALNRRPLNRVHTRWRPLLKARSGTVRPRDRH